MAYLHKRLALIVLALVMSAQMLNAQSPAVSDCYTENPECGDWENDHAYVQLDNGCTIGMHYKVRRCSELQPGGGSTAYCEIDFSYFYVPTQTELCDGCPMPLSIDEYTVEEIVDQVLETFILQQYLLCGGVDQPIYVKKPYCWIRHNVQRQNDYDPEIAGLRKGGAETGGWTEYTVEPCGDTTQCCETSYVLRRIQDGPNVYYSVEKFPDAAPPAIDCSQFDPPCESACQTN